MLDQKIQSGEHLVQLGLLTPAQLEICLTEQRLLLAAGYAPPVSEIAIRNRFCAARTRTQFGQQTGSIERPLLAPDICTRFQVVPVRVDAGVLLVRAARAITPALEAILIAACAVPVAAVRVQAVSLNTLTNELRPLAAEDHSFATLVLRRGTAEGGAWLQLALDALFTEAVQLRASDIHLDRKPDPGCWVSFRIDGELRQRHLLPARTMAALLTRLKTDAGLDASNQQIAQDGRLTFSYRGRLIDLRLGMQPLVGGDETVALRILDAESLPELEDMFPGQLGITEMLRAVAGANGKKGGIVLTAGTTGSGKSTTLACLTKMLPRDRLNLVTVEDPVEYRLPFARQIQVNSLRGEQIGDFERSLLRQDPDIIMLGEIRDAKSAKAAMQLAESGHMVLATMHATGLTTVFERIAGFFESEADRAESIQVLSQHLRLVIHQHLIPRLCECAAPFGSAESRAAAPAGLELACATKHRVGCLRCGGTGQYGRVLLHETLMLPRSQGLRNQVQELAAQGAVGASQIPSIDGVAYQSKHDTLLRLLAAGVIDYPIAQEELQ